MPQEQTEESPRPLAAMPAKKRKISTRFLKAVSALCATALFILAGYYFISKNPGGGHSTEFSQVWRLVPEKVSKSAAIKVYAPADMTAEQVAQKAKFDPEIPGHWVTAKTGFFDGLIGVAYGQDDRPNYEYAEYKPDKALTEGLYYGVTLAVANGNELRADFLAAEDPRIDAIFPGNDMEAPEDSKISIVFNRPMAALSTADMMEPEDLPIEVTPQTEGKWKWISTNTLQFIPAAALKLSSNYKVKINSGLESLDGLAVAPAEGFFKTRNLRYLDAAAAGDNVVYNQPYRIYFNQPVDLEQTAAQIKVADAQTGKPVEYIAQYKKIDKKDAGEARAGAGFLNKTRFWAQSYYNALRASLFGTAGAGDSADTDKSVIEIYGKKDKFGRKNYWDTDSSYQITIGKAYPAEGDIIITAERQNNFATTGLIGGFFEEGGRSDYNNAEMFDPQGKLGVRFYEDIDLQKCDLTSPVPITKKEYGKKCSDERLDPQDSNCSLVDDKKIVLLTFDGRGVSAGQKITLNFEKIVNAAGDRINGATVPTDIFVYQPLEFYLAARDNRVELNNITLCSNNPLAIPEKGELRQKIDANLEFELFGWDGSRKRNAPPSSDTVPNCKEGEFETNINIGLIPGSSYEFTIAAADLFGQTVTGNFSAQTGPMKESYTDLFLMQQDISVTTADKTTLTYGSENIDYADVSICKLTAYDYYRQRERLNGYAAARQNPLPENCLQTVQKRVQLPERYWLTNYFDVNVADGFDQPLGNYIVTLSNPFYKFYDGTARYLRSFITITGLSAAQKALNLSDYSYDGGMALTENQLDEIKNIYWVSDIKTLAPVSGARVSLYSGSKNVGEALTDASGVAMIKPVAGADLAVVQYGRDSTIIAGYDTKMNYASDAYNVRRAYIYTDRPIYRPGDKINIKGILRLGYDGNYQMWDGKEVKIDIRGPRWDTVATPAASVSDYGTFGAEYVLDGAAALGDYEICVKGSRDCGHFSVKEYSPAAFKVDATTSKDEYVSGDKIKIDVGAQYYFGVPVADADVEYTISSQNYYFDKYDESGYNFGYYEDCPANYCYGDKFIGRGVMKLDNEGKGTINETIDLQKIAGDSGYANSRIIIFDITAKNSMGQSISAQKSVIVHAGEVYLGAKASPFFAAAGQAVSIEAQAVDIDGKKSGADNVSAAVYKVDWIYAKRREAGGYYNYDWTKKRDLTTTVNLDSKGNGRYAGSAMFANEGEYEIDITGKDKRGITVMSRDYVYIYGNGAASIRLYDDNALTLKAEKESINAGEQGSLIIESPFEKAKALIAIERGKVFKYDIVDITGNLYNYKFDAVDDYAPNVYVSVLLQSADPAVKFGTQEFKVNSDAHKLNIEVSSDKKTYKPGENVVLDFHARDRDDKPAAADISIAVVDVSVLALAGNPKKDPLIFFYDGLPLTVNTYSSVKEVLLKVDKESRTKGGSGGGSDEAGNNVRGEFRDTAFWRGSVTTGSDGNARLEFKLPDNLTTWQAEAVGVTKDTKLGAAYTQFMSRNDLMVVPVKPRFIVPGDQFYAAAQVFNQSDKARKVKISFASDTLKFTGKDKELEADIKAGDSKTVYFEVMAPLDQTRGIHSFTISADGGGISDAIKQTIPVVPNLTYEAVATANYITGGSAAEAVYLPDNVSKEQGGLTVRSAATLAVFLSDALNYFIAYPYGCTEQIASRLKAMAAVKEGLSVPNLDDKFKLDTVWVDGKEYTIDDLIDIGLNKIYKNQNNKGGFGMWDSRQSDYYATLQAVAMLEAMKSAGVAINQPSLERALGYLNDNFNSINGAMSPNQIVATAAVLLGDGNSEPAYGSTARAAIVYLLDDKTRARVLNDQLSNRALAQLSIILSAQDFAGALKDVNAVLDNRITIDSRGAFLQMKKDGDYDYYETAISDTALYLKSLAAGRRDTVYTDKIVRWILGSREKDGAWGSTQNTLAVITAFTDFLKWKHETESEFTLAATFNGEQISKKDFNAQTILDQSAVEVPAAQFKTGANNIIGFTRTGKAAKGGFYYDMGLKYYLSGLAAPRDEGFSVSRAFYALDDDAGKTALAGAAPGQVMREHIEITTGRDRRFVAIEDYIPAGMEIVDMSLATEQKSLKFNDPLVKYNLLAPDYTELRDDRAFIYSSYLKAGTYQFDYYVRALAKGDYLRLPCVASEFYNPENFGRSASSYFEVK